MPRLLRNCYAKQHYNPFETFKKQMFTAAAPIDTATAPQKPAARDDTCWSIKTSISCETSLHFTVRSFKTNVFLRVLWTDRNIDVSCEASVYFHHMSQNALPPRNLHIVATSRSADNAIRKEHATRHVQSAARATQNDIGGVQSAAPAAKNARHVLRVPHKTTFDTL